MSVRDLISMLGSGGDNKDPNFKNVSLLLNGDGTNGAQNNTFLDSSSNNFTITRNGNTTQGTFSPYGNLWSNYLNGTTDYLSIANNATLDLPADFTVETWVYCTSTANADNTIIGKWQNPYAWVVAVNPSTGAIVLGWGNNGSYVSGVTLGTAFTPNKWVHVAVTRSGSTLRGFINGQQVGSNQTVTSNLSATSVTWIGRDDATTRYFNGYISNLRIVKGTALYTSNFTPSTTPLTAVSGTSLLTCQSNRFIDNSSNNFAITVNGNTSVQRFSPFNPTAPYDAATIGGSGYFDGAGGYLTATYSINWSTIGPYTLEFWVYHTSMSAANQTYASTGDTSYTNFYSYANGRVAVGIQGTNEIVTSAGAIKPNEWTHIAYVYDGTDTSIYINGKISVAKSTAVYSNNSANLRIATGLSSKPVFGYISDFRIVKSVVYTTSFIPSFAPSTTPLTAIANTAFLGAQDVVTKDYSTNNYAMSTVNGPTLGTSGPFGTDTKGYGIVFGQSSRQSVYTTGGNFAITTGPFTIEGWIKPSSYTGGNIAYNHGWRYGNTTGWVLSLNSGYIELSAATGAWGTYTVVVASGVKVSLNVWTHFSIIRDSNNVVTIYINGAVVGKNPSYSASLNLTAYDSSWGPAPIVYSGIGATYSDDAWQPNSFHGQISNIRISKTTAFYNTYPILGWALPTSPLTPITNTSLLCNFTNAGIPDAAMMNDLETVGNAQVSTSVKKYGTGSLAFDGSGDWLTAISNPQLDLGSGDFTIEFWIYMNSVSGTQGIISKRTVESNYAPFDVELMSSALKLFMSTSGSSWAVNGLSTSALSSGTWYHLAFVRSGNTVYMYLNGVSVGSTGTLSGALMSNTAPVYIGSSSGVPIGATPMNGYIDDLRITKGYARYTANFTPPAQALPTQ